MTKNSNAPFGQWNETAFQQIDEMSNTSRRYVDAMMKSSNIFAQGAQDMAQGYMQMFQEMGARSNDAMRGMMSSKSLNEVSEEQNKLVQQGFQFSLCWNVFQVFDHFRFHTVFVQQL